VDMRCAHAGHSTDQESGQWQLRLDFLSYIPRCPSIDKPWLACQVLSDFGYLRTALLPAQQQVLPHAVAQLEPLQAAIGAVGIPVKNWHVSTCTT